MGEKKRWGIRVQNGKWLTGWRYGFPEFQNEIIYIYRNTFDAKLALSHLRESRGARLIENPYYKIRDNGGEE